MTARDPLTPARLSDLSRRWIAGGAISVVVVTVLSVSIGPASIAPGRAALAILNLLPMIDLDSGLTPVHESIVTVIRLPRGGAGVACWVLARPDRSRLSGRVFVTHWLTPTCWAWLPEPDWGQQSR